MGRMDDPAYIGAIAIGGIIFNILYWGLGFLRPGTTGLTAQAYGAGDKDKCYRLLYRAGLLGLIFGLILIALNWPIGQLCFQILSGTALVESLALEYYSIRILAAPVVIILLAGRGWFFGMQDAISPMILMITANVLNIFISWYLVIQLNMSVKGVALGTVLAQYLTFIVFLLIMLYRYRHKISAYLDRKLFQANELRAFIAINRDMFIRNIGMILVFSFFTDYAARLGNEYLAVSQILLQLFYFMSYAVDGFAYSSESLVGKYLGSNAIDKVFKVINKCLIYGLLFGCCFAILFYFGGHQLVNLFTSNEELLDSASTFYIWLSLVSIGGALAFIWDGVFSGATAGVELRNSMIISVIIFFMTFLLTKSSYPEYAIWISMFLFMLGRSLCQIYFYQTSLKYKWINSTVSNV